MGPRLMCGVKPDDDDNTFPNLRVTNTLYRIRNIILDRKVELNPLSQHHSSSSSPLGHTGDLEVFVERVRNHILEHRIVKGFDHLPHQHHHSSSSSSLLAAHDCYKRSVEVILVERMRHLILDREELNPFPRHHSSPSPLGYEYNQNLFRTPLPQRSSPSLKHSTKYLSWRSSSHPKHPRRNPINAFLPQVRCSSATRGYPAEVQSLQYPLFRRYEEEANLQYISQSVPVLSVEELNSLKVETEVTPGSYAKVHKVTYRDTPAIRKVMTSALLGLMLRETRVLLELNGAGGAPRVLAVCTDPPAIVMEYAGVTFRDYLHGCRNVQLILETLAKVCDCLQEIHAKGYIHCDLKANNITVSGDPLAQYPDVHIIDFGLATPTGHEFDTKITGIDFRGQSRYLRVWMSPEMKAGLPLHPSSDVYSLGVLMVRIMMIAKDLELARKLNPLLLACTHPDPDKRPKLPHIAEYLRDLKCKV